VEPEQVLTVKRLDELFAHLPLTVGDNVWLVGGCEGLQVEFLLETYPGIQIDVYEPQLFYVEFLRKRFEDKPVFIHPYALGDIRGDFIVGLQDTECTFHWKFLVDAGLMDQPHEILPMEDVADEYCSNHNKPKFLMMNCEGSELEIIERLNDSCYIKDIPNILTQFHLRTLGVEGCQKAYDILNQTHDVGWRYKDWAWVYAEVKV
jgi:hypothetical protein